MRVKTGSLDEMAASIIDEKRKIVLFGAGVIGTTTVPSLLQSYNLVDQVLCYIDNSPTMWNQKILMGNREINIEKPEILRNISEKLVVLINISRYEGVIEQVENLIENKEVDVYIIPRLCVNSFLPSTDEKVVRTSDKTLIPKIIHYMWLGENKIPDKLQRCIDSWKYYCPDYEIICWNEKNYDLSKSRYMRQAYENKKYGFVPDYARIDILYQHGGIYMDTDVEIIKPLDDLLYQEAFCSVEKWQVVNFGGCSGAAPHHRSLQPFLRAWERREFVLPDGTLDKISSGVVDTKVAIENGYKINGKIQNINGMIIYPYDFFHPYDYMSKETTITNNTFAIHHFNGSWV